MNRPVNALVVGNAETVRLVTCANCYLPFPSDRVLNFGAGSGFPERNVCEEDVRKIVVSWRVNACPSCDAAATRLERALTKLREGAIGYSEPPEAEAEHREGCRWKK